MKKLLGLFLFTLMMFSYSANAAVAKVDAVFFDLIADVEVTPAYRENTTNGWKMLFHWRLEDHFNFEYTSSIIADVISNKYISITKSSEWSKPIYRKQCVGFVKIVSSALTNTSTSSWVKGAKFNANNPPAKGTILATFNPSTQIGQNGGYSSNNDLHKHVLIYWGKIGNTHYVIDQNWSQDGVIQKHSMSLSATSSSYPQTGLNNYHIVEI